MSGEVAKGYAKRVGVDMAASGDRWDRQRRAMNVQQRVQVLVDG
jgi:hypothetical protein